MNVKDIIVAVITLLFCGVTVFRAMKYGSTDVMVVYLLCGLGVWQTIIVPLIVKRK